MIKEVNLDTYSNGYSLKNVACTYQPSAAVAGSYCYDNYYYYCFYYGVLLNWYKEKEFDFWNIGSEAEFSEFNSMILEKMGLTFGIYEVNNSKDFEMSVRAFIDDGIPVIMAVKRNCVPYDRYYGDPEKEEIHIVLITGYDNKNPVYIVRDYIHVEASQADYVGSGYGLFRLCIGRPVLVDMWSASQYSISENGPVFSNKIFTVERKKALLTMSYIDVSRDFIKAFNPDSCRFNSFISNYPQGDFHNMDYTQSLRVRYYGSLIGVFDGIKKALEEVKASCEELHEYLDFKDKYLKYRKMVLSKLHFLAVKGETLDREKKHDFLRTHTAMNDEFIRIIKRFI